MFDALRRLLVKLIPAALRLPSPSGPQRADVDLAREVEERPRAQEASAQALLKAIIDNSPAIIYVKDIQGRYLMVNRRYTDVFHLASEAVIGKTDHEVFPKAAADAFSAMDERVTVYGKALTEEEVAPHDDGQHTYLSVKCPLWDSAGRPYAVFGISTDITDRKRAEETAQRSQEHLLSLVEQAPISIAMFDRDMRYVVSSRRWIAEYGRGHEDLAGRSHYEIHPDVPEYWKDVHRRAQAGEFLRNEEDHWVQADGSSHWLRWAAYPWRNAAGEIGGISISAEDITPRKQAEEKLRAQVERLNLLQHITHAIGERQDLGSIFRVLNHHLEESFAVDFGCVCLYDSVAQELTVNCIGVRSATLARELAILEQTRIAADPNGLAKCLKGELVYEPDIGATPFPFFQRLAQGGLHSLVIAPLRIGAEIFGALIVAQRRPQAFSSNACEFLRQLSEHVALAAHQAQLYGALHSAYEDLRQTQHAILQQERLRALGQMASGIAHDINNAISPVALYTESLLAHEENLSERARNYLGTIQRAIDDVAQTVARMREFYRPCQQDQPLTDVALNRLIQQVLDLTRARWSDQPQQRGVTIELRTELAPHLPGIVGAESEIRDALTNLIFNAVDAMPQGGVLTVRTREIAAPAEDGSGESVPSVELEVADNGVGMDVDTRRRCLEPFFTTKGERGSGLGLAMVYGMARRHGADLKIDSAPGRGTAMQVVFPVRTVSSVATVRQPTERLPMRPLRILMVDDDPLVIDSLRNILQSEGHQVTAADGGQAGISAFRAAQQGREPFEVVITDLGMPYVDGRKVADSVHAVAPNTPVIMLTGWGQRLAPDDGPPPRVECLLSKPPRLHELRAALARCCELSPD
jgi:PAS domain S-box-containing protein